MNRGPFINPIFFMPLDESSSQTSNILNDDSSYTGILTCQPPPGGGGSSYTPSVQILYNGSGLHNICGTTPMITLGHTFNRTEAGMLLSVTNKINLSGKIYDRQSSSTGIDYVLGKEKQLKDLFFNCPINTLEVKCGCSSGGNGTTVVSFTGVRALSISTENSQDFLTKSIGYTIDLENVETSGSNNGAHVVSASDTWNIEPVADDYIYESFSLNINTRNEYDNPNTPDGAPSVNSPKSYGSLQINQIPQYKISRKLSARGVLYESTCGTGSGYHNACLSAKQWVSDRLAAPWQSSNSSGVYFGGSFTPSTMGSNNLYLYNHIRATSFSVTEGSYEVNDTWLAMPTGITHIEDYTIDVSTDEKFVKTIKVNGTIKGLSIAPTSLVTDTSSLTPSGDGKLDLSIYNRSGQTGTVAYSLDTGTAPTITNKNNRYENALIGWHSGVKPFLYRRASAALNAPRYTNTYVPGSYNRTTPLNNPTYSKDSLLNIIPWSTSETHDPRKGVITYGYEFNNKFTIISGVISESISIDDTGPTDVVAEVFVIGRRLGPILQSLSAKTSSKRSVSIDITVMPVTGINQYFMTETTCPMYTGGNAYSAIEKILEGLKPFGTRDGSIFTTRTPPNGQVYQTENSQSWNPTEGRYTRKASWVYQQCDNGKLYLDT